MRCSSRLRRSAAAVSSTLRRSASADSLSRLPSSAACNCSCSTVSLMPASSVRAAPVSASMRCSWLPAVAPARALSSSFERHSRSEKPASCASRPSWTSSARASRKAASFCRCSSSACSRRPRTSPRRSRWRSPSASARCATGLLGLVLALQFGQVAVDLRRALLEAGLRLGQLQRLHLRRMEGLLRLLHRTAGRAELALGFGQRLFGRALHFARRILGGGAGGKQRRPVRRSRAGVR